MDLVDKVPVSHIPAMLAKDAQKAPKPTVKSKPTCARCKNHGKIVFRKGHSQNCEYLNCKCAQCHAIKMRNDSMAKCMSNERKSTIPKVMGFAEADSSCSSTTPVMCSSAIKPEYHDTFDDPQTPDTTSYERPVKRLRTSPPTSDALSGVQAGYGYLQQDARATWGPYDCLRQTVDPRYNIYPGGFLGMAPFPQPAQTHPSLEERKRLLDPAYKVATSTGRAAHPSASYQVNALLRSDSNSDIMMHSSFRQLLQQMSQPEESGLNNAHKNI